MSDSEKILISYVQGDDPTVRYDYFTKDELNQLVNVDKKIKPVLVKQINNDEDA